MITSRGWWLIVISCVLLGVSLYTRTTPVILLTITVIGWFCWSLLVFAYHVRLLHGQLTLARRLDDEQGPVQSLWAEKSYRVRVQLRHHGLLPSPYLSITERPPYGAEHVGGELFADGIMTDHEPLELSYTIHCTAPGRLRFEGVHIQCSDLQGLFYHTFFLRRVSHYRVLPALADIKGHIPTVKRLNLLPLLGAHAYRAPGSGSELLDLRDYIPGDPPKTIAWKVSARRNRLITKVFESEVPIRCIFFVDTSDSVRVGNTGHNALSRLVTMSAALTQAMAGERDLPGLCLFDDEKVWQIIRPARNAQHVIRVLNVLAEAAALLPSGKKVQGETLLPLGYGLASEVYPDLLTQEVNHFPLWLPWWAPRFPRVHRGLLYLDIFLILVLCTVSFSLFVFPIELVFLGVLTAVVGLGTLTGVVGLGMTLIRGSRERQLYRWRKKMSALLAVRQQLGPDALAELCENDGKFNKHLQEFLSEHHVPYTPPLYNARGEYYFASPQKVEVLAKALLQTVARGKDNELYVLLVDLLELENLDSLLRAVKVAIARHHQVIFICPWPVGVPLPSDKTQPSETDGSLTLPTSDSDEAWNRWLQRRTITHLHNAYYKLRRTFGRIGVTVQCAADDDSIKLILDRLKYMRYQTRGVR